MKVDVLVVGAHPDDADLGLGGTILTLIRQGATVGILDLTEGELASRGTVAERRDEATEAAKRLGVTTRVNACLPDGGIQNDDAQRRVVVERLRAFQPAILIHHHPRDRHPDHETAHHLVRDAAFLAGVSNFPGGTPHRPDHVFLYHPYGDYDGPPTWIMDISPVMDEKMHVLEAYRSQLYNPDYTGAETFVSSRAFWEGIRTRAAYWGLRADIPFGEPLHATAPMRATTLPGLENLK